MKQLAVLGPGLLGGSIALAVRRLPGWKVAVWARRAEAVEELQAGSFADLASTELKSVVRAADLIVLCVPIGAMPALAVQIAPLLKPGAVVTDVGSVKATVVQALTPLFPAGIHFVGSHPMAGSEQTGLRAARADLFRGTVCMLTPEADTSAVAVQTMEDFWSSLGCEVRRLSPVAHDETVALISHLPHLVAAALVNTACAADPAALGFAGPGFRDTTRVASGPPEMWAEILEQNLDAVRRCVEAMIVKLRESIKLLDSPPEGGGLNMNQFLAQAKAERDRLRLPP